MTKFPWNRLVTDIPDPIEVYSIETIGEDLYRNAMLCGYTKTYARPKVLCSHWNRWSRSHGMRPDWFW
jgi:hypothetical protein